MNIFHQAIVSAPQSNFTIPAGYPLPGASVVVHVNGRPAAFSWTNATTLALRVQAPARAIVDFYSVPASVGSALVWSGALDFPSIAPAATAALTATVPGAELGDVVSLGQPSNAPLGVIYQALVTAANVVTVRATNITAAAIDAPSGVFRLRVSKA